MPNNTTTLNNLGLAYMRISEFNNAAIAFKKAIDIEPGFNLAINNLNWAMSELKKSKQ
jgi:Flp pilus assembly protein TadD